MSVPLLSCTACWERLRPGGEGDDRGWDSWMASLTQWTWIWVNPGSWWWTGRPGTLQSMGSQKVGHNWTTELNWSCLRLISSCRRHRLAMSLRSCCCLRWGLAFRNQDMLSGYLLMIAYCPFCLLVLERARDIYIYMCVCVFHTHTYIIYVIISLCWYLQFKFNIILSYFTLYLDFSLKVHILVSNNR